jgi:hypothetical protein
MTLKINKVQILLRTKYVQKFGQNPLKDADPRVFTRMLRKEGRKEGRTDGQTDGQTDGRTDGQMYGSVTIFLCNFVGEGITIFLADHT